jgi:hypothetical protein
MQPLKNNIQFLMRLRVIVLEKNNIYFPQETTQIEEDREGVSFQCDGRKMTKVYFEVPSTRLKL